MTLTGSPLSAGLRGRCPRCGEGRLFESYLKIIERCDTCGLGFGGHDVGDGPVVPAIMVLGGIIVGLALWVELSFQPSLWVHAALWTPLTIGGTLAILPLLKGLSVGLQFKFRSTEEDGGA
ncbi:MAG: DUF983 domain-containing protein [Proteobacteria bacterium]|nr:DUF983 domain-containing protein [Pseudomonadota bacterium]